MECLNICTLLDAQESVTTHGGWPWPLSESLFAFFEYFDLATQMLEVI